MKIIIVDDDKILRLGLKCKIEKNTSYEVVGLAHNGYEALELIKSSAVDLIITDIQMPGMDGIELVETINTMNMNLKIVVLSGYDEYRFVRKSFNMGAIDYLLKPIENHILFGLLDQIKINMDNECKNEQQVEFNNQKVSESIGMLKEKFVLDFTRGVYNDVDTCRNKLSEFGITDERSYVVAIIGQDELFKLELDSSDPIHSGKLDTIKAMLANILLDTFPTIQILATSQNLEVIILFLGVNNGQDLREAVSLILSTLREGLIKEYGTSLSIGQSEVFNSYDRARIAYQQAESAITSKSEKIIDISIDFIRKNYSEELTLTKVADYVHLNPTYFSELFKKKVGKNFIDYLTEIRIKLAKKLLINTDTKVYEVGQRVGYSEPVTFNRAFKRIEGVSPSEYRRCITDKGQST